MAILRKSLSSSAHIRVLQVVGLSKVPLSSRQIEKKAYGSNADIYRIVKELAGILRSSKELFTWEDIDKNINDGEYKHKLIKKLNHFCGLNLEVAEKGKPTGRTDKEDKEEYTIINNRIIELQKIVCDDDRDDDKDDTQLLVIRHRKEKLDLVIKMIPKKVKDSQIVLMHLLKDSKDSFPPITLVAKRDDRTRNIKIYTKDHTVNPFLFLKISHKQEQQDLIKVLQERKQLVPDSDILSDVGYGYVLIPDLTDEDEEIQKKIYEIKGNQRNYRYSLTIKGLLLYLLGANDIRWEQSIGKRKRIMNKTHTDTRSINSVLTNLSENYLKEFPFLLYYKDFQELLGRPFMIRLFKDVAIELQHQLDTNNNEFLRYWLTYRYFNMVNNRLLNWTTLQALNVKMDIKTHIKLKDYRLYMLQDLKDYQEKQLKDTNLMIEHFEGRGLFSPSFIH